MVEGDDCSDQAHEAYQNPKVTQTSDDEQEDVKIEIVNEQLTDMEDNSELAATP